MSIYAKLLVSALFLLAVSLVLSVMLSSVEGQVKTHKNSEELLPVFLKIKRFFDLTVAGSLVATVAFAIAWIWSL